MPSAAMVQAMIAPNGPVAFPKARGSEKVLAPTIEPTTIMVSANTENFCVCADATVVAATGTSARACVLSISISSPADWRRDWLLHGSGAQPRVLLV